MKGFLKNFNLIYLGVRDLEVVMVNMIWRCSGYGESNLEEGKGNYGV